MFQGILAWDYLALGVFCARTRNLPDDFMWCFRNRIAELDQDTNVSALSVARTVFVSRRLFEPVGMQVLLAMVRSYLKADPLDDGLTSRRAGVTAQKTLSDIARRACLQAMAISRGRVCRRVSLKVRRV
jgi:hypothetical protein